MQCEFCARLLTDVQHQIPAKRFMSRTQANPNRWYYACARDREDPKRCKFFKWEDELGTAKGGNVLGGASPAKGQTLGGAPGTPSRLMRPTPGSATPRKSGTTPSNTSTTPSNSSSRAPNHLLQATLNNVAGVETPSKRLRRWNEPKQDLVSVPDSDEDSSDIDWGSVDADKLEEEALSQTNTPRAIRFDTTPMTETRKRKLGTLAEDETVSSLILRLKLTNRTPSLLVVSRRHRRGPASSSSATAHRLHLPRRTCHRRRQAVQLRRTRLSGR